MQKLPSSLIGTGLLLLSLSIFLGWLIIPFVIESKIEKQCRLINGTETFEKWSNIKSPIYLSFYIFNVTNGDDVVDGGKPILQEVGPYVYEEKRTKIDISIDELSDTISYRQPVTYWFRPDLSNGTERDNVTIVNVPLVGLSRQSASSLIPMFMRGWLNLEALKNKETLFVNKEVGQILFGGYKVDVVESIQNTTGKKILNDKSMFGFYYGKNGSDDGEYRVHSGTHSSSQFGQIVSWNNESILTYWGRDQCNMINGTDGSLFPPFITKDRILRLFTPDLCRSLHLRFQEEVEISGIKALRFTVPKELLESPDLSVDNECFCKDKMNCEKTGVIPLASCRNGAPVVASTPHFLDGDEFYLSQSIGLSPDRLKHQTFIDVEPTTGLVLFASKRIQINIDLSPTPSMEQFKSIRRMMMPVFWAEESGGAGNEETLKELNRKLIGPLEVIRIGKWSFLGLSLVLILVGCGIGMLRLRKFRIY